MAKSTTVLGSITKFTGGKDITFGEKNIVAQSNGLSVFKGLTGGVELGEPGNPFKVRKEYSLAIDLAWLSMVGMYDDLDYAIGTPYLRAADAYKFKLEQKIMDWNLGFRCYIFSFTMYGEPWNAVVFMGTRPNNFGSLTDNLSQGLRMSSQVNWAKQIGRHYRWQKNVIFAGHSKGGREAAFAGVTHGKATVYSYNTSIAYLDDNEVYAYNWNNAVMHHFTVAGEVLMMSGANGWNAGFKPTIFYPDDVRLRTWKKTVNINGVGIETLQSYHSWPSGYRNTPDGEKVTAGEQFSRHSDYNLMLKGLTYRGIMSPDTKK